MKKLILLSFSILLSVNLYSQGWVFHVVNQEDSTWSLAEQNTPTSAYGNRKEFFHLSKVRMNIRSGKILLDSFPSSRNDGTPTSILWVDNNKYLKRSNISGLNSALFTGTTLQYVRGDGSLATFPTISTKRQETYSSTTNGSGVYSVTYTTAYSTTPNVQPSFITSNPRDVIMVTSSSTTGFTVQVQRRVDVLGLLPSYTNQSGVTVNILVTEQ